MAKTLNVRLINRQDTYSNWASKNPVLEAGEIALVKVTTAQKDSLGNIINVPRHLIKVGDGTSTFSALQWVTAPASDVYDWAKLQNPTIDELPDNLKTAIKNLQLAVGADGSVADSITAAIAKLDYTDEAAANQFVTAVVQEDGKIAVTRRALTATDIPTLSIDKIDGLKTRLSTIEGNVSNNATAIADEVSNREAAINTLTATVGNNKIAAETGINEAKAAASAAQSAADKAQGEVDTLGQTVATLTQTVATNKQDAATALADAKADLEATDTALDGRLDAVEAKLADVSSVMDFVGAVEALPAEGNNQSGDVIVVTAGDNAGKEFVYDDSREDGKKWVEFGSTSATDTAVAGLQSRMSAAETAIDTKAAQSDLTALGTRVTTAENEIDALQTEIAKKALATDLTNLATRVSTAEGEIDTLQKDLSDLEDVVDTKAAASDLTALTTEVGKKALASDLTALTNRVTTAEGKITTAEGKISTLESKVATNEGAIATINNTIATLALDSDLDALDERVDSIEANFAKVEGNSLKVGTETIILSAGNASTF